MDTVYSVTEINKRIKYILESEDDLNNIFVIGEISNVKYYRSGHLYFSLKDNRCTIKCAAFKYRYKSIPKKLEEGEQIKAFGRIGVYDVQGNYQLIVDHIEKENELGKLYEKLEKIKMKLKEKGYFELENKKELPKLPLNIGVVTSPSGAAIRDIINMRNSKFENVNIYLYPAKVQGEGSAKEIIKGIDKLNEIDFIDVIIVGRGGGSIEDLWSFNEESVSEAIFNSKKPIVSAVGHESDYMLSDLVADVRAATPTNSMEIVLSEKNQMYNELKDKIEKMDYLINEYMKTQREKLTNYANSYILRNFTRVIEEKNNDIMKKEDELNKAIKKYFENRRNSLNLLEEKLKIFDKDYILEKGYSIVTKDGKIVKSINSLEKDDKVNIRLKDGNVSSEITQIRG